MSEWQGTARSNYVRVKDRGAFLAWVGTLPDVEVKERSGMFALFVGSGSDNGAWPVSRDAADGTEEAINLSKEIAPHLEDGEVFVYLECGADAQRYITGSASAVNSAGETINISLNDIYAEARRRWNCIPEMAEW